MTAEEPRLDSVEYLGADSPTLGQRAGDLVRAHRAVSALLLAVVLVVAASVGAAWWRAQQSAPPPMTAPSSVVSVGSTGQGGVVLDRSATSSGASVAIVAIELTVRLADTRSAGRIVGTVGPGVTGSSAPGIPPIEPGQTSVGVVTTRLDCSAIGEAAAYRLIVDYRPTGAGTLPSTLQGGLGGITQEWAALLRRACAPN